MAESITHFANQLYIICHLVVRNIIQLQKKHYLKILLTAIDTGHRLFIMFFLEKAARKLLERYRPVNNVWTSSLTV